MLCFRNEVAVKSRAELDQSLCAGDLLTLVNSVAGSYIENQLLIDSFGRLEIEAPVLVADINGLEIKENSKHGYSGRIIVKGMELSSYFSIKSKV